ncbi:ankyrin repeat-containing domain protein [Mycena galopus ATCC 62051]|nr:ankyrin repeat-containing domain protein [Mycena galopus ATCC 62051]
MTLAANVKQTGFKDDTDLLFSKITLTEWLTGVPNILLQQELIKQTSYRFLGYTTAVLIKKGANVNAQGEDGYTQLQAASSNDHLDIVRVLIEKGANVNVPGKDGETALQAALRQGRLDLVQFLWDKGAE